MTSSCFRDNTVQPWVKVNNKELFYIQEGEGVPLIFLPPPIVDNRIYCHLITELSSDYRVISLDLPQEDKLTRIIDAIVESIRKGTQDDFHLVASSATGWIAQYIPPHFPNQILSLTLINTFHSNVNYGRTYNLILKSTKLLPSFKFRKEVIKRSKLLRKGVKNPKEVDKYFKNRVNKLDKDGIRRQMKLFISDAKPPSKLEIPILFIYAKQDPIISKKEHDELLRYHQNVTPVEIDTQSHLLFLSHRSIVVHHIKEFTKSK